jgi:2-oxoglutarate dehydrogenase complex dehydrogenase (E1) component-like enzyme
MDDKSAAVDWERIELDYRAGVLSLREIASLHSGTNHVAITRRAKKEGWTRDLAAKIKAKADDLVTRQAVTPDVTAQRVASERQVIEANAEQIARVRGEHRGDISRVRTLGLTLLAELEGQSADIETLNNLGEMLRAPDESGMDRLNDLYRKIISTPSRVDSAKKVAETLKHAITMEREAYGLDEKKPAGGDGQMTIIQI